MLYKGGKTLYFYLIVFVFFFVVFPVYGINNTSLLKKSQRYHNNLESFSISFSQSTYNSIRDIKKSSKGILNYMQPGLMHWKYDAPDDQLLLINEKQVCLYDFIFENVTIQELDKIPNINSLNFLRGKGSLLSNFKEIKKPEKNLLTSQSNQQHIFLHPITKSLHIFELQLSIDKKTFQIKQLVVIDSQKNYQNISFSQIVKKTNLKKTDFQCNISEGMEVIQD